MCTCRHIDPDIGPCSVCCAADDSAESIDYITKQILTSIRMGEVIHLEDVTEYNRLIRGDITDENEHRDFVW